MRAVHDWIRKTQARQVASKKCPVELVAVTLGYEEENTTL